MTEKHLNNNKKISFFFKWGDELKIKTLHEKDAHLLNDPFFFFRKVDEFFGIPLQYQIITINGFYLPYGYNGLSVVLKKLIDYSNQTICNKSNLNSREACSKDDMTLFDIVESPNNFINIRITTRLLGGKGGFGSLLKGQRTTVRRNRNFDACRDLNGRRTRHGKALDKLITWMEKKKKDDDLVLALSCDEDHIQPEPEARSLFFRMKPLNKVGEEFYENISTVKQKVKSAVHESFKQISESSKDKDNNNNMCSVEESISTPSERIETNNQIDQVSKGKAFSTNQFNSLTNFQMNSCHSDNSEHSVSDSSDTDLSNDPNSLNQNSFHQNLSNFLQSLSLKH